MAVADVGSDLARAARGLRRSPGFAALTIATLGLGIGAAAAAFTVVDQVILEPLPVREQEGVVVAWNVHTIRSVPHFPFFRESYEVVREGAASLEAVAATFSAGWFENLARIGDGEEEVVQQSWLIGDVFGVLGVVPAAGRMSGPTDDLPGAKRVAVISWDLWTEAWGRGADAIGASVMLADEPHEVVGVAPRGFDYPLGTDVWVPHGPTTGNAVVGEGYIEADLLARMRPGVTREQVAEELAGLYAARPERNAYQGVVPVVVPFDRVVLGDLRAALYLLLGSAAVLLLMAAVNVASLVAVRTAGREGSLAVKQALGAGRARLAREAFAEATWLGVLGGACGIVVAALAIRVILPLAPAGLPRLSDVAAAMPTVVVAAGAAGVVTILLGIVTVLRARSLDLGGPLRAISHSGSRRASSRRNGIVVAQTALVVWCAAVGILLLRSLVNLQSLDPGFAADELALVELQVPYAFGAAPEDYPDRLDGVGARLEALPTIEAVTSVLVPPLIGDRAYSFVPRLADQTQEQAMDRNPMINWEVVGSSYFEAIGLPVVRGRPLTASDLLGTARAVVVNEAAARLLWPDRDALGQRIGAFGDESWTVIGVAADARYQAFIETRPVAYFAARQLPTFPPANLLVRTSGPVDGLLASTRSAMAEVDPAIRVKSVSRLAADLAVPLARPRFAALMVGLVALATLLLGAVGVYGVMAASVRARSREVGVRMACGAAPARVRRMILGQGSLLAAAGALIGGLAVLPGSALLESLLFGVAPSDPWSLGAAVALVLTMAFAACWIPARRAGDTDPMRVLRGD